MKPRPESRMMMSESAKRYTRPSESIAIPVGNKPNLPPSGSSAPDFSRSPRISPVRISVFPSFRDAMPSSVSPLSSSYLSVSISAEPSGLSAAPRSEPQSLPTSVRDVTLRSSATVSTTGVTLSPELSLPASMNPPSGHASSSSGRNPSGSDKDVVP